jgi:mono/diheme cytochrome c family protein
VRYGTALAIALALASPLAGCVDTETREVAGRDLYLRHCASCHGPEGRIEAVGDLSSILRYAVMDDRLPPFVSAIEGFARSSETPSNLEISDLISYIQQLIQNSFPKDYTLGEMRMLILVTLKRLEEKAWLS